MSALEKPTRAVIPRKPLANGYHCAKLCVAMIRGIVVMNWIHLRFNSLAVKFQCASCDLSDPRCQNIVEGRVCQEKHMVAVLQHPESNGVARGELGFRFGQEPSNWCSAGCCYCSCPHCADSNYLASYL